MAIDLTPDNLPSTIENNDIVLLDFWAPWCGPCRSFAPVFDEVAGANPDIVFGKINTEEQQQLAATFGIRSIPTLMVFREKIIVFEQAGALPKSALEKLVEQVRALDMDEVRRQVAEQEAQQPTES